MPSSATFDLDYPLRRKKRRKRPEAVTAEPLARRPYGTKWRCLPKPHDGTQERECVIHGMSDIAWCDCRRFATCVKCEQGARPWCYICQRPLAEHKPARLRRARRARRKAGIRNRPHETRRRVLLDDE